MVLEKLRAVFYARVSTEEERQLNALEKQVAECKDAVLQKGWKLVDQYVDEGKSGTQIRGEMSTEDYLKIWKMINLIS